MRVRSTILLFCLSFVLLPMVRSSATNIPLRVNEAATRVSIREGSAEVALAIENLTAQRIPVRIHLEWLDPKGHVPNRIEIAETVLPGANTIKTPFPLYNFFKSSETLWYRLKYRVTANGSDKSFAPVTGIVSISEITPNLFELRIIASEYSAPGQAYQAQIRAVHPMTSKPIAGVRVKGVLKFDNDNEDSFSATGITDRRGFAALAFNLPKILKPESGELKVTGQLGDYQQEAEMDLRDDYLKLPRIILTTDKPLYQPGQTLHIRALATDFNNRALPNLEMEIEIEDPENSTQFRSNLKTSRFGVANVDWTIPDNTRLGDYEITVSIEDDEHGNSEMRQTVKITRYELPNFAVKTKTDRAFYLPGQNAEVEIRADYLFGQPVKKAKVRLVRETERRWNYKLQKWESNEEEGYEGETDATGKFTAKIDLSAKHKNFEATNYRRFEDLTYAAYFTDQTTGRTEQKRFDLRVTRDPIHVYLIEDNNNQIEGLPMQLYLSASYADGSPAMCEISISERIRKESSNFDRPEFTEVPLQKVKTNRFGLAKVSELNVPARERKSSEISLSLAANDGKGATGYLVESQWLRDYTAVRVQSNKTIYLKGEAIELQLASNQPNTVAVLNVVKGFEILHSQIVRLRNGRAFIVLPYRSEFNDELSISAIAESESSYRPNTRMVIYPRDRELQLGVSLNRAEYRPGDEAVARFQALTAAGLPTEAALGVSVIDRAVQERAQTDNDFGKRSRRHNFISEYLQQGETIAGISERELRKLDTSKPISTELQLAAEILLRGGGYQLHVETSSDFNYDQRQVFRELVDKTLHPLKSALNKHYDQTSEYPRDRASLDRILNIAELNFDDVRDPWANKFRPEFGRTRERDYFKLICAGADKKFGTADDFPIDVADWNYFKPSGDLIRRTAKRSAERDGRITLDANAFKAELKQDGMDFDLLRDSWGKPYSIHLSANRDKWTVAVNSPSEGGFNVWSGEVAYFHPMISRVKAALEKYQDAGNSFPNNAETFQAALKTGGIDADALKDFWGNLYYGSYMNRILHTNMVSIRFVELQKNPHALKTPEDEKVNFIELRSKGPDGQANTSDDFTVAQFNQAKLEKENLNSQLTVRQESSANAPTGTGAIKGIVTDYYNAIIAGATARAVNLNTKQFYESQTNAEGVYLIRNLPSGSYRLMVSYPGFKILSIEDIPVRSATLTEADVTLEVGTVSEVVMVSASVPQLQTESASVVNTQDASLANVIASKQIIGLPLNSPNVANLLKLQPGSQNGDVATPRLREHFQETLVWAPQLETDKQGRAQLKFKLADNITTWKLAVIGSTIDGQIGYAEKDFTAFQPFFAELDPPRVLTEGDEIALPVVLRNYLNKAQTVTTEMKPESWFALLGSSRQRSTVNAADAAKAIFDFRALASVKDGKQRVTAIGTEASDAIEKPVSVHPDGEEVAHSYSQLFSDRAAFDLNFPANTIKGSARAELKIYPNLRAHVLESIEAILQRPHGCGEQTISSTYPSLLALRLYKLVGGEDAPGAGKAKRYLQAGYDRLIGYRHSSGGFAYWHKGEADLALTAYALKFLHDAAEFVTVDEDAINDARGWVFKQQNNDGSWNKHHWDGDKLGRRLMDTAYVTRVMAMVERQSNPKPDAQLNPLKQSLEFLSKGIEQSNDAYVLACAALAAFDSNELAIAQKAITKLQKLASEEAGTTFWTMESNTPFYSWGKAGQVETTAIAAQALMRSNETKASPLVAGSMLFLLRNKDRYGVWHSTQATVNALDALLAAETLSGLPAGSEHKADILLNGKVVASVVVPPGNKLSAPLTVDLSSFITGNAQQVEIRQSANSSAATAQLVTSHYRAWAASSASNNSAKTMNLSVKYDRNELKMGEDVTCQVEAARVGGYGQGMLLAEIGLPPGAEVDRASLEKAVSENGYINQYDVLPDRVVVYLWPRTGGVQFSFKFKLRYGIKAQSAPSVLYDYYNPDAKAVIAPTRFVVK